MELPPRSDPLGFGWSLCLPAPQLGPKGIIWTGGGVRSLLAAVAREGVEPLGGPLAARIRECAGEGCALLFVDASRSGSAAWA